MCICVYSVCMCVCLFVCLCVRVHAQLVCVHMCCVCVYVYECMCMCACGLAYRRLSCRSDRNGAPERSLMWLSCKYLQAQQQYQACTTVQPPINEPPRKGQPSNKGHYSGPFSHSSSSFLTSKKMTTSQLRTRWLVSMSPLVGGYYKEPLTAPEEVEGHQILPYEECSTDCYREP